MSGVVLAGTHSGCGKTTITLGILAALKRKGHEVQPFKAGPDFIDTGLHSFITGRKSRNLDLWMCGEDYVKDCFDRHSADADIAIVEGVMGMYDGDLSTAALAGTLGLPVILVVDAYGMAESAGAIVKGFVEYGVGAASPRPDLAGIIFNRVASDRHYKRLRESVKDVPVLGYLPRNLEFKIPHRHLGLVVAEEKPMDKNEIDKLADAILEHIDIDKIMQTGGRGRPMWLPGKIKNRKSEMPFQRSDIKIAVAYDKAFCFYYEDNFDLLKREGAEIITFSPLSGKRIPDEADALYLGGGYPELHAKQLSNNETMIDSVRQFAEEGGHVYAECGGFMYLTEGVYDLDDNYYPLAGIFPFKTKMTKGRARLGYRETVMQEQTLLGNKGETVRGHEFHYSQIVGAHRDAPMPAKLSHAYSVKDGSGDIIQNEGYRIKNTLGSYIHLHFGSNELIANKFIENIKEHHGTYSACRTRQP